MPSAKNPTKVVARTLSEGGVMHHDMRDRMVLGEAERQLEEARRLVSNAQQLVYGLRTKKVRRIAVRVFNEHLDGIRMHYGAVAPVLGMDFNEGGSDGDG